MTITGFGAMARRMVQIGREGRAAIIDRASAHINGLFERITGGAAGELRSWRWHDHGAEGGTPLARGCLYSHDTGEIANKALWSFAITSTATDFYLAREIAASLDGELFPVEVSEGIDSSKDNLSANPCALRVDLLVSTSTADATAVRVFNKTTGQISSPVATSASAAMQSLTITDLRCVGGRTNWLDLVVRCNSGTPTIFFHSVIVSETRALSQPDSEGNATYSAL